MLFFLIVFGTLAIIFLLIFIILLSSIKIKIENLRVGNIKVKKEFQIKIQLYFLNKIKIFSIKFNKKRLRKIYNSKQLEKIDLSKIEKNVISNKNIFEIIKRLNIKLEELQLDAIIGTEDAVLTSYITGITAGIIGIILPHIITNAKKINYSISPIYVNKNRFNLDLDCIIYVKIVHIIYVMNYFIVKGRKKDERTSNRRTYDYSYGQY